MDLLRGKPKDSKAKKAKDLLFRAALAEVFVALAQGGASGVISKPELIAVGFEPDLLNKLDTSGGGVDQAAFVDVMAGAASAQDDDAKTHRLLRESIMLVKRVLEKRSAATAAAAKQAAAAAVGEAEAREADSSRVSAAAAENDATLAKRKIAVAEARAASAEQQLAAALAAVAAGNAAAAKGNAAAAKSSEALLALEAKVEGMETKDALLEARRKRATESMHEACRAEGVATGAMEGLEAVIFERDALIKKQELRIKAGKAASNKSLTRPTAAPEDRPVVFPTPAQCSQRAPPHALKIGPC
ncbi:hypothetical protein M885DRAFT_344022 [Pelagophyceae sp. CCMP2097]|nr:hypothetical protein M885DRAFT_344022 [Pelagophyceae sp. CCMP2097]